MTDTHHVLPYVDNVNLLGDIRIIERNACKDIGLAVNTGKTTWK